MANKENQPEKSKEEFEFEKELKRLKLSAECGAHFADKKENPPIDDFDDDFLQRMKEVEDAIRNPDIKEIIELLGFPTFPDVDDLRDDELEAAIDLVTMALANENIVLDVIHPTPQREIYRFLTKELLFEEAGMAGAGGMTMHFIYEEYYPNFEEEIKSDVEDILNFICRGHKGSLPWRIAEQVRLQGKKIPREEFEMIMEDHRHVFKGMSFIGVDSLQVDIQEEEASATANFRYYLDKSSGSPGEFSAKAEFHFEMAAGTFELNHLIIDKFGIK